MRRATGLDMLSRRDFCAFASAAVGLAVVGCTDGDRGAIQTGPLGGGNDDAPKAPTDATDTPDAVAGATCGASAVDVGVPQTFATGNPVYFSSGRFFVVRDADGLYALTSLCTHEGAVTQKSGTQFYCPRHGARFTQTGAVVSGPVNRPLGHFAMCTLANGHVGVMTNMPVSATVRLVA